MTSDGNHARVGIRTYPIWRVRLARELPRYVLVAAAAFGLLASARFAVAPPRPIEVAPSSSAAAIDPAAQAYAALFARRYLTWNAREPARDARELEPFVGTQLDAAAGFVPPPEGSQEVEWVEVVQSRETEAGSHVYTVAAQTSAGLLYLTVGVTRTSAGALALTGYPALVGAPAAGPPVAPPRLRAVEDAALQTVVRRGLGNYLAGATTDLAADLAPGAAVSSPPIPLQLISIGSESWAPGGGSVLVTVHASDGRGARYVLTYELDVTLSHGRWELSAIQTEPDD